MDKKIIVYDPPMCCASGVCGPNPDQNLLNFQNTIIELKKLGISIERRVITSSADDIRKNPELLNLIREKHLKALPIIMINDVIVKHGSYPSLEEFKQLLLQ